MELRRSPRVPLHCPITYYGTSLTGVGTVSDLSRGGCKVGSPTPVDTGTDLELHIYLTRESKFPIKVELAKVRWAMGRAFGLEFIRVQPEEQVRLRRFVSCLETSPSPQVSIQRP